MTISASSQQNSGSGTYGSNGRTTRAAAAFRSLRFHDLRHQAITELAERGASDATVMALAGHLSRAVMEHYSARQDGGETRGGGWSSD